MDDIKTATASAVESITTLCKLTVMNEQTKNATSRKQSNTTAYNSTTEEKGSVPSKPLFVIPDVLKDLCPGDCSGNGRCKNSKCICNSNFTASDCSIEKGEYKLSVALIPILCESKKIDSKKTSQM